MTLSWFVLFLLAWVAEGRIALLEEYISKHSASYLRPIRHTDGTVDDQGMCNRQYMISAVHCRSSVGNEFMMFLNELALSVILNRTMLLHVDAASCDSKMVFASWIPRFEGSMMDTLKHHCNMTTYVELSYFDEERETTSPVALSCCNVDRSNAHSPLLRVLRLDRMQASTMALDGARVYPETRKNAMDLFSIPGKGPLYGYGQIFQATLKFSKTVQRWNEHFISTIKQMSNVTDRNLTILGTHLRHQIVDDPGKLGKGESAEKTIECLANHLPKSRRDNCVVVLATDREHAVTDIKAWAQSRDVKCMFMHSASAHEGEEKGYGGGGKFDSAYSRDEHGPWGDGLLVFTDMHLMSQSNLFVGSKSYSTYASSLSILFASIIAGHTGLARTQHFLPSCTTIAFNGEIINATRTAVLEKGGNKRHAAHVVLRESPEPSPYASYLEKPVFNCSTFPRDLCTGHPVGPASKVGPNSLSRNINYEAPAANATASASTTTTNTTTTASGKRVLLLRDLADELLYRRK